MKAEEFKEHRSAFRAYNRSRDLSQRTIESYDGALQQFYNWLILDGDKKAEIGARCIREFIAYKLAGGIKCISIRYYTIALRAFFGFLLLDEVISKDKNPMRLVKDPRIHPREIRPLSNREIHSLLDSFDKHSPAQYRDFVICLLILDTGLRLGEVCRLTTEDVDWHQSRLRVNGKGKKIRMVYMGQKMAMMLQDYIEYHRPEIANGHLTLFPAVRCARRATLRVSYLSGLIREKMREAGAYERGSSAHRLRHTFAINFLRNGGNVFALQRLLGHSNLEMTRRYVMLAEEDLREAHRKASPVDRMEI